MSIELLHNEKLQEKLTELCKKADLMFNLLIMIVKPLQTAWNPTSCRVTPSNYASGQVASCLPLRQYVIQISST